MSTAMPNVKYGKITGKFYKVLGDGIDPDRYPDGIPEQGLTIEFKTSVKRWKSAVNKAFYYPEAIVAFTNSSGILVDSEGAEGVYLIATDQPGDVLNPREATWTCTIRRDRTVLEAFNFLVPSDSEVDLSMVAPVTASGGVQIVSGPRGPEGPIGPPGTASPEDVARALEDEDSAARTALNAAYAGRRRQQVSPSLYLYEHRAMPLTRVFWQEGQTLYAGRTPEGVSVYRSLEKSTNRGKDWTVLNPNLGFTPWVLVRLRTGTLVAIDDTGKVRRSADEGATWTHVHTVAFLPLSPQGCAESPNGEFLISEYGNVQGPYRIFRTVDDGLTFETVYTSDGVPTFNDPGHIHYCQWDPYEGCFLAYEDRPTGYIWRSTTGAAGTWTKVGDVPPLTFAPNFVSAMLFPTHIAWGYDSEKGGVIARMKREDFYAGRFGDEYVEVVVDQLDNKAHYTTFPLTPDVWMVTGAIETIGTFATPVSGLPTGHMASQTYIVDQGGSRVSPGFQFTHQDVVPWHTLGSRATFPGYVPWLLDHKGFTYVTLPDLGSNAQQQAMPVTLGWTPPLQSPTGKSTPMIPERIGIRWRDSTGTVRRAIVPSADGDDIRILNEKALRKPEVRLTDEDSGLGEIRMNGVVVAKWTPEGFGLAPGYPLWMGDPETAPSISWGSTLPEGVANGHVGSIYLLRSGTGAIPGAYVKMTPWGTLTGWETVGARLRVRDTPVAGVNTTIPDDADFFVIKSTTAIDVTLPAAAKHQGRRLTIKNATAIAHTLKSVAPSMITSATARTLAAGEAIDLIALDHVWHIV